MTIIGYIMFAVTFVLWVGVFGGVAIVSMRERGRRRLFGVSGGLLVVLGFLSFLAPVWAKWLPSSIEWPIGWAGEVITLPSGMHVVAHDPSNRVQVYDADWKYIRGWYVDCAGGVFVRTKALPDGTIEVITARTHMRYVFDLQGQVISKGPAPPNRPEGPSHVSLGEYVPTWPWLLTLTHPFIAVLAIVLGFVALVIGSRSPIDGRHQQAAKDKGRQRAVMR